MDPEQPELRLAGPRAGAGSGWRLPASLQRGRLAMALVLAWLTAMGVAGWVLARSQASSRATMVARMQARTNYAATFISIYARDLAIRERSAASSWLATSSVSGETLQRAASALGLSSAVLLDARGRAIVTLPHAAERLDARLLRGYAAFAATGAGQASRITLVQMAESPMIAFAVRYPRIGTRPAPRVFAGVFAVADTVLPSALDHIVTTRNWQGYLVDPSGSRLSAGLPGPAQAGDLVFTAPVAGTPWRVVIKEPASELYSFVNGPGRWLAWLALCGLAVAGLAVILLIEGLARKRTQLIAQGEQLARLAAIDTLTGLRNRRAIEQSLHDALSAARRHSVPVSVLVIDVDHFKAFNDRLGHRSGDAVLAHTARVMDGALRAEDAIGRWGGEEFLVVMPGTEEAGALSTTERLRAALAADQPDEARANGMSVTITIGVAEWQGEEMSELVSRADQALYRGKASGRDVAKVSTVMATVTEVPERA